MEGKTCSIRSPVAMGVLAGIVFWIIDSIIDFLFHSEAPFLHVFLYDAHEISFRLLVIMAFIVFGYFYERTVREQENLKRNLSSEKDRAIFEKNRFEAIVTALAEGICMHDTEMKILYQNDIHKSFVGGDFRGRFCYEAYHGRDEPCEQCPVIRSLYDGNVHQNVRERDTNGEKRHFEVVASPVKDSNGNVIATIESIRDITDRMRIEIELQQKSRYLSSLLESMPDGVLLIDGKGTIMEANPAALELGGIDNKEEVMGTSIYDFVHPSDAEKIRTANDAVTGGKALQAPLECRVMGTKGKERMIEARAVPFRDPATDRMLSLYILRDVTEARKMENYMRHAQKMDALGSLTGSISHEFNNILTAVMGFCEFLEESIGEESGAAPYVKMINDISRRGMDLTRRLLTFSRRQETHPEPLMAGELITRISGMIEKVIGEDIEVSTTIENDTLVLVDPGQIEQVMMNLALNARDAMPGGGHLKISVSKEWLDEAPAEGGEHAAAGNYAVIRVSDTGTGMDRDTMERIFEPFFTTKSAESGTGLGLPICHGIIKNHSGLIEVESAPGKGTTFIICLPAADVTAAVTSDSRTGARDTVSVTGTVLLVEDDSNARLMIQTALQRKGVVVLEASGCESAIRIAGRASGNIGTALIDIVLPDGDSMELAAQLSAMIPALKLIFITGYPEDDRRVREIAGKGYDIIYKPLTASDLYRKIT